ncbi:MAG TPA: ankyrin repeat domain-containing protein [Pyrinomonadaceae bacterium]|nr:ankyrin repeat domain-containing protein [Pyrinomonadaceae bacterium]
MSAKALLDQLQVQSPCTASWDSMIGTDQIRFCEHCHLSVHNLSSMTRKDVRRLVRKSKGRLCVRYESRSEGPFTTNLEIRLHQIRRRVSRVAAGAFSAALSVTGAANALSTPVTATECAVTFHESQDPGNSCVLVGTVRDVNGALITSASVSLSNHDQSFSLYTSCDSSAEFRFEGLAPGIYHLTVVAPGFAAVARSFYVGEGRETHLDQTLEVEGIEETVGVRETSNTISGGAGFVRPLDPLIRAAQEDELEEVSNLIAGREVNLRDKVSRTTALEHAVLNANREMVQLLLSAGAKVDAKNESGETVLMMLDADATTDLVWDLINAGADVNAKDNGDNTPLIEAASGSNVEVLKTLLEAGAKVNATNKQKQTALMMAASEGMVNNVRLLLLSGAEVNAVDHEGKNSLSYAMEVDHKAVIRLLRSQGGMEVVAKAP